MFHLIRNTIMLRLVRAQIQPPHPLATERACHAVHTHRAQYDRRVFCVTLPAPRVDSVLDLLVSQSSTTIYTFSVLTIHDVYGYK